MTPAVPTSQSRTLFILKKRSSPYEGEVAPYGFTLKSSGLFNSASFVHQMLIDNGRESKLVEVVDNNDIDREVTLYRPTTVIIEALWVVPSKFEVLRKLHPNVHWVIRSHSELPFAAAEGTTMSWFFEYMDQPNVSVAFNSLQTVNEFRMLFALSDPSMTDADVRAAVWYLPNYYPVSGKDEPYRLRKAHTIRVGCFGAIRPLKNQLIQAVAAIQYATQNRLNLEFHINGTRIEGSASSHLKNLRGLFAGLNSPDFKLVEHSWHSHEEFLKVIRTMDIGLQVSFTESFNIVTADFVNAGIPVVTSSEIEWVAPQFYAECTSSASIVTAMKKALWHKRWVGPVVSQNRDRLRRYSAEAKTH